MTSLGDRSIRDPRSLREILTHQIYLAFSFPFANPLIVDFVDFLNSWTSFGLLGRPCSLSDSFSPSGVLTGELRIGEGPIPGLPMVCVPNRGLLNVGELSCECGVPVRLSIPDVSIGLVLSSLLLSNSPIVDDSWGASVGFTHCQLLIY